MFLGPLAHTKREDTCNAILSSLCAARKPEVCTHLLATIFLSFSSASRSLARSLSLSLSLYLSLSLSLPFLPTFDLLPVQECLLGDYTDKAKPRSKLIRAAHALLGLAPKLRMRQYQMGNQHLSPHETNPLQPHAASWLAGEREHALPLSKVFWPGRSL